MAVTTTYSLDFVQDLDLLEAGAKSQADATSLADGRFIVSFTHQGHTDFVRFDPDGGLSGWLEFTGTNSAIDQLTNGNLAMVTQDADSIIFTTQVLTSGDPPGVNQTDLGDTNSSNPDVAALTGGGFVIVNQDLFGGTENDIDVRVRDSGGGEVATFSVDASDLNDTNAKVAALDDGGFVVAWTRAAFGPTGDRTEIWYAVYEANGGVRKAPTRADMFGPLGRTVDVSSKSGGFVLVYADPGGNGTDDITLAEFDSAGSFQSASNVSDLTFEVDYPSNDANPRVTRLSNDLLVVGYEYYGYSDSEVIVALFDANSNQLSESRQTFGGGSFFDDVGDIAIAGSALGRINVLQSNFTTGEIDGETLQGRRTSVGDAAANTIIGDGFIDNLNGAGGNDSLNGGANNDTLKGGAGADTLNGSVGIDIANYTDKVAAVTVTLNGATQVNVLLGGVVEDRISNIERVWGGSGGDRLTGDGLANGFAGLGGNDTLKGQGGADNLDGGPGNDNLGGGAGKDTLNGGANLDTANYNDKAAAVSVALNGSAAANVFVGGIVEDRIVNIENLWGGGGNDTLGGDSLANYLAGGGGHDRLTGNAGNDTLVGGIGADLLTGSAGPDRFDFNLTNEIPVAGFDTIADFSKAQGDKIDLAGIDAIAGGANDAFTFIGGAFFTAPGQIRAFQSGANAFVLLNTSGTSGAEAEIRLSNFTAATLAGTDFVL